MDFDLSEDQESLGAAARSLLERYAGPHQVRAHLESGEPYDRSLWDAMVEQGWLGGTLPEKQGGLGLGWVEAAVLLGELGRHTAPAPFLPTLLASATLAEAEEASLAEPWICRLVAGEAIGAVAWSASPDAVTASEAADGWRLAGRCDPADGLTAADVAVVPAGDAVFVVDLAAVGRPQPQPAMDQTRSLAWLELDGAPAIRVGGAEAADRLLDRGALGASAEMLGGAEKVLEMAVEYAKERVQFGQPIGSFQAVKHRCADMLVDVEGMRSAVWHGAWCLSAEGADGAGADDDVDGEGSDPSVAASTAKVWCSDASRRVMGSALQVHGGIGFTWEHDLHLYLKRAQFDRVSYGDASFHRARLAATIRQRMAAGVGFI